jgi:hypothetical protein
MKPSKLLNFSPVVEMKKRPSTGVSRYKEEGLLSIKKRRKLM